MRPTALVLAATWIASSFAFSGLVQPAWAGSLPGAAPASHPEAAQDDDFEPNAFHLYDTQAARARAKEASDHIAAGRWSEALAELQALIEEHRGEVLGASRPQPTDARQPSQSDVHAGAGMWAAQQLFALPEDGRRLYRARFGPRAMGAFDRAKALADRGGLARVAQRWPLTDAAERAWWALGDLEVELGHPGDGRRAWARAAAQHLGDPLRETSSLVDWERLRTDLDARVEAGNAAAGALARVEFALSSLRASDDALDGESPADEASFVTGVASGIAADALSPQLPRRPRPGDIGGWQAPFPLSSSPYRGTVGASRLFPARLDDTLFVNTSRSVHAIDVFDGQARWTLSANQIGWQGMSPGALAEFEKAVDGAERIVGLAASRGVVVAPLQIPWSFEDSDHYNELSIIELIPERRLFAVDAASGEVLWDTLPPAGWRGDSGSFAERMTVVGPPRIVGARVVVPMAQLRGRIELHLGCFDLATGAVLWTAPLVTGQRTLNMFGRSNVEFSAPPPVVAGDTVVMLTQLGIVAAVDLFTGETRWNTLYEQVDINAPRYYTPGTIENRWSNAPPVVHGNTIVAAPYDGDSLMALDLDTGAVLWSQLQERIPGNSVGGRSSRPSRMPDPLSLLLAANDDHLLLGGAKVASVALERGLRGGPPTGRNWVWPEESVLPMRSGFPVADARRVYVPDGNGVTCLDRATGRVVEDIRGALGRGQLLVSRGMLFTTDGSAVDARFEWSAMVGRARAAAKASAASARDVSTYARLMLERAESMIANGVDVDEALTLTDDARTTIESYAAAHPGEPSSSTDASSELTRDRHRALLLRAHAMRLRGDSAAARLAVNEAIGLDAGRAAGLEALLLAYEIERRRDFEERTAILDRILRTYGSAPIVVEAELPPTGWDASDQLASAVNVARMHANRGTTSVRIVDPWQDPWLGAIRPSEVRLGGRDRDEPEAVALVSGLRRARVSGALFAHLGHIEAARELPGRDDAVRAELKALHAILRDAADEPLFLANSAGLWAETRIHCLRALHPDSPAWRGFEDEAVALFDRGVAQARATGKTELLESIPDLFPGSGAARRAAEARIEYALESGAPEAVAAIVLEALPVEWHPARSTDKDTELLVQLAHTMGRAGNRPFRTGLLRSLARYQPDAIVPTESGGSAGLGIVAAAAARSDDEQLQRSGLAGASTRAAFDAGVLERAAFEGDFVPLGTGVVSINSAPETIGVFASRTQVVAIMAGGGAEPLWSIDVVLSRTPSTRTDRGVLTNGRLVLAAQGRILCVDAATGTELWTAARDARNVRHLAVQDGVVVACFQLLRTTVAAEVLGFDLERGIELWQLPPIGNLYHPEIRVSAGRFTMLPMRGSDAAVHDLFTGHPTTAVRCGKLSTRAANSVWIDKGRLVVPQLEAARSSILANAIAAYELDDGRLAWSVDLDQHAGGTQNLLGVIEMPSGRRDGELVRLAMLAPVDRTREAGLRTSSFGLYVLNERLGALDQRPLATIGDSARLLGIYPRRPNRLSSPILLSIEEGRAGAMPTFRAIDPQFGELWQTRAVRNLRVVGADKLGEPVLGNGVVAVMVNEEFGNKRGTTAGAETKLMFLDSASGAHVETRSLESKALAPGNWKFSMGFGQALIVSGMREMKVYEGAKR